MSKTILITGTSSGFGKMTAELLASKGYKVYATMRGVNGKNAAHAKALAAQPNITVLELDVTDAASVAGAVDEVIGKEGRLDVLVNNAGVFTSGIAESFTEADLDANYNVNVKGPWRMLRATLPQFRSQGEGLIINISSGLGRFSAPFMTIYNSSKFALEGLVEGSHYELKGLGVENVLIQPGAFPTELSGKTQFGSDTGIAEGYGELANVPAKMGESLHQLFASEHAPDPKMVPQAVLQLVETPKGQRPLRTVVDPLTGTFTETANAAVYEQYKNFLTAFGMADLLN